MKAMIIIMLVLGILFVVLTSYPAIFGRIEVYAYNYAKPEKTIEHFFDVELPEDTEILEYDYLHTKEEAKFRTKLSFSADGWESFSKSMTNAGYELLDAENEREKALWEAYEQSEMRIRKECDWWSFDEKDSECYHSYYASGYCKCAYDVFAFAFYEGESVIVYMDLGW